MPHTQTAAGRLGLRAGMALEERAPELHLS